MMLDNANLTKRGPMCNFRNFGNYETIYSSLHHNKHHYNWMDIDNFWLNSSYLNEFELKLDQQEIWP